ncbi:MAG: DUF2961 domain-containing protein [Planctomycetes bacterium]|nr:DUF2961 domain-containing protein [Planctomycetota bacterium]
MRRAAMGLVLALTAAALGLRTAAAQEITLETLLREMVDLERLTRVPEPAYKTVQFSSYDRRSEAPDRPDWFANADGFGKEPVPGFEAVLEVPREGGSGRYLVCDVEGPGAIVRGWTAGMEGTLKVVLDGSETPVYDGPAEAFLRHRLEAFARQADVKLETGRAFQQEDADYFPLPFARRLRIEWTGALAALHFYQIGVRHYDAGARVRSFRVEDIAALKSVIEATARQLLEPGDPCDVELAEGVQLTSAELALKPGEKTGATLERAADQGPGAVRCLKVRVAGVGEELATALRAVLLRIWFDGASVPQIEAPLGDFFGAAPGLNPYRSLPMEVRADGTLLARFVMPFRKTCRYEFLNTGSVGLAGRYTILSGRYAWDEARSMHFRARWRVDHGLFASNEVDERRDMPFLIARGAGRYVGTALSLMNPCPCPMSWGNWWGEGDEKVFVDGEARPSTFGTGSEDYFNYSWSRAHLFEYPYAVQPLVSGPDHHGYVTNIRWHILDDLPFTSSLEFSIELFHHTPTPGLSYARIGYHYGRPGLRDDHPPLARGDLSVPPIPAWSPIGRLGSHGAVFHEAESLWVRGDKPFEILESNAYAGGRAVRWTPPATGTKLHLDFNVASKGNYLVVLTCGCSPEGGRFKAFVDGRPLEKQDGDPHILDLSTPFQRRLVNFVMRKIDLDARAHTLTFEALGAPPGELILDYFWLKP